MNKEAMKAGFSLQYKASPNDKIVTLPNLITAAGILCIVFSAVNLYAGARMDAFYFFLAVIISDFLDGFSARYIETKWPGHGISKFGEIIDPIRDKGIVIILFFLNVWMAIAVVFFESLSVVTATRVRKKAGKHVVAVESKVITAVQFVCIGILFFISENFIAISIFSSLIATLSLLRFITYVRLLYK
jgi:phosphatidylglycerophosphate synthase